ncbi:MAG: hypothetical protein KGJ07_03810, partial [Patescibacteria group bacterium]|nr:hypothetical protein [Patescibacteria group bacterium]
ARATGFSETQIRDAVAEVHNATFAGLTPEGKVEELIIAMHLPTTRKAPLPNEQALVIAKLASVPVPDTRKEIRARTDVTDFFEAFNDVAVRGQPRDVYINFVRGLDINHRDPVAVDDTNLNAMYDYLADPNPAITSTMKYFKVRGLVDHLISLNP